MVVENGAGEMMAVVTSPDGGIVRDEAGNIIVLVTDENGKNVKGENGEYKTNAIAMDHAIVLGRRVEAENYSVEIGDISIETYRDNADYSFANIVHEILNIQ